MRREVTKGVQMYKHVLKSYLKTRLKDWENYLSLCHQKNEVTWLNEEIEEINIGSQETPRLLKMGKLLEEPLQQELIQSNLFMIIPSYLHGHTRICQG